MSAVDVRTLHSRLLLGKRPNTQAGQMKSILEFNWREGLKYSQSKIKLNAANIPGTYSQKLESLLQARRYGDVYKVMPRSTQDDWFQHVASTIRLNNLGAPDNDQLQPLIDQIYMPPSTSVMETQTENISSGQFVAQYKLLDEISTDLKTLDAMMKLNFGFEIREFCNRKLKLCRENLHELYEKFEEVADLKERKSEIVEKIEQLEKIFLEKETAARAEMVNAINGFEFALHMSHVPNELIPEITNAIHQFQIWQIEDARSIEIIDALKLLVRNNRKRAHDDDGDDDSNEDDDGGPKNKNPKL